MPVCPAEVDLQLSLLSAICHHGCYVNESAYHILHDIELRSQRSCFKGAVGGLGAS